MSDEREPNIDAFEFDKREVSESSDCLGTNSAVQIAGRIGVVYLAEQKQARRRVALKVIKVSMDTRQAMACFEAER